MTRIQTHWTEELTTPQSIPEAPLEFIQTNGGREDSDPAGDCVARAITLLMTDGNPEGTAYRTYWEELAENQSYHKSNMFGVAPETADEGISRTVYENFFAENSIAKIKLDSPISPAQAASLFPTSIIRTKGHMAALINGNLMDSWDSRQMKVNTIYIKKERQQISF